MKPGSGILEQVEIDIRPFIDEGGFPESSKFLLWVREMNEAHDRAGQPLGMDPNTQAVLEHLGYVDVRHDEIKVPYNSWPAGDHERDLGKWFNLAMTQGLSAMSLAPLTRMLGYKKDQVDALLEEVKEEICDRSIKSYCIMWVLYDYAYASSELTWVIGISGLREDPLEWDDLNISRLSNNLRLTEQAASMFRFVTVLAHGLNLCAVTCCEPYRALR